MKPRVEFISCEWRGLHIRHNNKTDAGQDPKGDPISASEAIGYRLQEHADHFIALKRLNDKNDAIISDEQMRELLGIQD